MSAYFAFFPLSNGLAFRALHLTHSFHGNYTQCWRWCLLAVSESKSAREEAFKNVITEQLREKKSIFHFTLTLPDVVWLASLPSRPFYFHCCGVMPPGLWMYILSYSSLSCLVTDFMVIFFSPCASYSELLNSGLAGFVNALLPWLLFPLPKPLCSSLILTPFLTFSPSFHHSVLFPWLPIPARLYLAAVGISADW